MNEIHALAVSECFINDPILPWSREVMPGWRGDGCAEMGGCGAPVFLFVPGPGRVRLAVPALGLPVLGDTRKIFGNLEIQLRKMQLEGGFRTPCCCPQTPRPP